MLERSKRLIGLALLVTFVMCVGLVAYAQSVSPQADTEFMSATVNLTSKKGVVYSCTTYYEKKSLSVSSCWLERQVNGVWSYAGSLSKPSTGNTNAQSLSRSMDYSSSIGSGTFRVAGTFNADGYEITRYSNTRTF